VNAAVEWKFYCRGGGDIRLRPSAETRGRRCSVQAAGAAQVFCTRARARGAHGARKKQTKTNAALPTICRRSCCLNVFFVRVAQGGAQAASAGDADKGERDDDEGQHSKSGAGEQRGEQGGG